MTDPTPPQAKETTTMTVTTSVETVTPDTAREWLDRNQHNRNLRRSSVTAYAADMAAGNWRITGEPVTFDCRGNLADGQHRLHAAIEADTPFETVVVRGIDPAAKRNIDTGMKRTFDDVLRFEFPDLPHSTLCGSVARASMLFQRHAGSVSATGRSQVTNDQLHEWFETHREVIEPAAATLSRLQSGATASFPTGTIAPVLFGAITAGIDDDLAQFCTVLRDGQTTREHDPAIVFRERVIAWATKSEKPTTSIRLAMTIDAWNKWVGLAEAKIARPPKSSFVPVRDGAGAIIFPFAQ